MGEQLLPGIPDAVTWNEIVPRLSGTAFHISAISRAWLHATRSYEVYNSRVQSHSTQTHVIVTYDRPGQIGPVMALYCMKDNSCVELPSISNCGGRIFKGYNFVSLDGMIYVLGGFPDQLGSDEVYVLDLRAGLRACQRQWKQCASMTKRRRWNRIGVIKGCGKIYVSGGWHIEPEVYEPKENIWSRIPLVTYDHFRHLYRSAEKQRKREADAGETERQVLKHEHILDEELLKMEEGWRFIGAMPSGKPFVASGNNHSMTLDGIFTIDAEGRPMTQLHSFSLPVLGPDTQLRFCNSVERKRKRKNDTGVGVLSARIVMAVQHVNNELLAMVWYTMEFDKKSNREYYYLLRSTGFGGKSKEIVWRKVQVPLSSGILFHHHNTLRYTLEL